jgi:hypothetical protein
MKRVSKVRIIIIAFILLLVSLPLGCTPAQTTTSSPSPSSGTNSPVAATPSQQASVPVVSTQTVVEKPTSFDALTYVNDEVGFSVKYPRMWTRNDVKGSQVLYVSANNKTAEDMLWVNVIPASPDLAAAVTNLMDKMYNLNATVISNKSTTLSDGKTTAQEIILTGVMQTASKLEWYVCCLGINHNGKTILVLAKTAKVDGHNALVEEIAHTLTIK